MSSWQEWTHRRFKAPRNRILQSLIDDADNAPPPEDPAEPHPSRRLANKLGACCRSPELWRDDESGQVVIQPDACGSRCCPRCADRRRRELRGAIQTTAAKIDSPAFVTLTLRSSSAPLREQIERLKACFKELRRRKAWKAHVAGGLAVVEVTYHQARNQWHPHLHVLCDLVFWKQAAIAQEWEAVTGDSRIVDVRRISSRSEAANYVAKYASKGVDLGHLPARAIPEACHALHGLRLAQTFGSLHGERTTQPKNEAARTLRQIGWLAELWNPAEAGDEAAAALCRGLLRSHADDDAEGDADLADAIEDYLQEHGPSAADQPTEKTRSGERTNQPAQLSLDPNANDPPCTNATGTPR